VEASAITPQFEQPLRGLGDFTRDLVRVVVVGLAGIRFRLEQPQPEVQSFYAYAGHTTDLGQTLVLALEPLQLPRDRERRPTVEPGREQYADEHAGERSDHGDRGWYPAVPDHDLHRRHGATVSQRPLVLLILPAARAFALAEERLFSQVGLETVVQRARQAAIFSRSRLSRPCTQYLISLSRWVG
jgi:hypothetical protein